MVKDKMTPNFKPLACLLVAVQSLVLVACQSESDVLISADQMLIPVPEPIRQVSALRASDLSLRVTVNGDQFDRSVTLEDQQEITVFMPDGQNNEIKIEWLANIGNRQILLADFSDIVLPGQTTLEIGPTSYISAGPRFDEDNDGRNNLQEAIENRNLLSEFDVEVPLQNTFGGQFSVILDDGIDDNLSGDPIEPERDTVFSLRHDNENLIVYVCGYDTTLEADSVPQHWNDDTIFIYLNGNDSSEAGYDGIDDFQLMFPRGSNEMVVAKGQTNQFCPDGTCIQQTGGFFFTTDNNDCEYEFQVQLPLAELNMEPGRAIGFDIELTDDDNGGLRDGSRGWIGFDDDSDINANTFGTIRLN